MNKITKTQLQKIIKEEMQKLTAEAKEGAFKKVFKGPQVVSVEIRDDDAVELQIVLPFEDGSVDFDGLEDAIIEKVNAASESSEQVSPIYPEDKGMGRGDDEPIPKRV